MPVELHLAPKHLDHDILVDALDLPALPQVEHTLAPSLWLDERLHPEANAWLREQQQQQLRNPDSVVTYGRHLVGWISHLRSRGKTVNTATEDDFRTYEIRCRYPSDSRADENGRIPEPVSDDWLKFATTTIKQFHEWLLEVHHVPLPFTLINKPFEGGVARGIKLSGRPTKKTARIHPLVPDALRESGDHRMDGRNALPDHPDPADYHLRDPDDRPVDRPLRAVPRARGDREVQARRRGPRLHQPHRPRPPVRQRRAPLQRAGHLVGARPTAAHRQGRRREGDLALQRPR